MRIRRQQNKKLSTPSAKHKQMAPFQEDPQYKNVQIHPSRENNETRTKYVHYVRPMLLNDMVLTASTKCDNSNDVYHVNKFDVIIKYFELGNTSSRTITEVKHVELS